MSQARVLAYFEQIAEAPGAARRLRRFILDLAVRGRLVGQDSSAEPASELVRRIRTEKARLVEAGELGKEKPLPPVTLDEEPFRVPGGWQWVRIRQVTSDRGQSKPEEDFTYIDVTAIDNELGRVSGAQILSASDAPSRARKLVRQGDVIYSCVRPYLLNIAIIESDIVPSPIASTAFAVLNGFGLVLPKYLWMTLRSPFMVECVEGKMRGQAYPAINDSDFAVLPFPLPPLAEQHRIVARVDELIGLCNRFEAVQTEREMQRDKLTAASLQRLNQAVLSGGEDLRKHTRFHLRHLPTLSARPEQITGFREAIVNLAVQGKLVAQDPMDEAATCLLERLTIDAERYALNQGIAPPRPEPITHESAPYPAPAGWAWVRLWSLFKVITDGDHQPPPKSEDGIAFLTIGNISTGQLDFSNCRFVAREYWDSLPSYRKPAYGDILYTVVGATYGRPALVDTRREICVQRHIAILKPAGEANLRYLCHLLASAMVYEQASRSITGAAQPTIPLRPLRNFLVLLPPIAEQHRIVAKVDQLIAVCEQFTARLTAAQTGRSRLLEAVFQEALTTAG